MSWLDRAAREIVEKAEPPTAKTDETPVLAVLAVPQTHISQKSGADESIAAAATLVSMVAYLRAAWPELKR